MTNQEKFIKILQKNSWAIDKYDITSQNPFLFSEEKKLFVYFCGYGNSLELKSLSDTVLIENLEIKNPTIMQSLKELFSGRLFDQNNPVYKEYKKAVDRAKQNIFNQRNSELEKLLHD